MPVEHRCNICFDYKEKSSSGLEEDFSCMSRFSKIHFVLNYLLWYTSPHMPEIIADFHIKPSEILLLLAGVSLLISLPLLSSGDTMFWTLSRVLYGMGVVLFFFDR